jgi:hypothetical protein
MAKIQSEAGSISSVLTTELDSLINIGKELSGEIDNSTGGTLDLFDEVLLYTGTFGATPSADATVELFLLESLDGTNYEDGSDSVYPAFANLVGVFNIREVTTAQNHVIRGIELPPSKFKYLIRNRSGQNMPSSGNTLE